MPNAARGATVVDLFTEVAVLEALVRRRIERGQPEGLSEPQMSILVVLGKDSMQGVTRAGLEWLFDGGLPNFDGHLEALAERGLVVVTRAAQRDDDIIVMSPDGENALASAVGVLSRQFEPALEEIKTEAMDAALATLREIRRTLDNLPDR
jgi:DNA-binding transcriptional ArsR family regulator